MADELGPIFSATGRVPGYVGGAFSMCHNCQVLNDENKAVTAERDEFRRLAAQLAFAITITLPGGTPVMSLAEAATLRLLAKKVCERLRATGGIPNDLKPDGG